MFNLGRIFAKGCLVKIENVKEVNLKILEEEKLGYSKSFNMMIKYWQDNNLRPNINVDKFNKNGVFIICPVRNAGKIEKEILDKKCRNKRYAEADHRLKQVGCDRGNTRVEYLTCALFGHLAVRGLKGRRYKTQGKGMICYHLKCGCAVSTEKCRVKHTIFGYELVYACNKHKYDTAQNRRRNQRRLQK